MTRKHYEAIALALAETRPDKANFAEYTLWLSIVERMRKALYDTCENFKQARFVNACHEEA